MTAVLPPRTTDVRVEIPGVYDGMDEATYFADPVEGGSLSTSGVKLLLPPSCPAKFKWEQDHPSTPKRHFDLGHAAHKLVLGAGAEFVKVDAPDYKTKAARELRDVAHEAGKIPILLHEYAQAEGMARAIRNHDDAAALFQPGSGKPEQSLFWIDEPSGIWRRARLDWLQDAVPGYPLICPDLKTCTSANPDELGRVVNNFRYHIQAAFYLDGIKACGLDDNPAFLLVFVEKDPPHVVTIVQPDREALRIGHELIRRAIGVYRECKESGHWPGYASEIRFVSLPPWAVRQHEENL